MVARMQRGPNERPRSGALSMVKAVGLFYASWLIQEQHLRGVGDLAGYGAAAVWLMGAKASWNSLTAFESHRSGRRAMKAANKTQDNHGRASWTTLKQLKKASMLKPGGHYLGQMDGRDVFFRAEGSSLITGIPGSGKNTCGVSQNLARAHVDAAGRPVSLVIFDMKCELYAVWKRRLEKLGYKIVTVCPDADLISSELGIQISDTGYNPILALAQAGPNVKAAAEKLAALLLPARPQLQGSAKFFNDAGRDYLIFGMMQLPLLGDPSRINLCELRSILMKDEEAFDEMLVASSQSSAFGGALAELANKIAGTKSSREEFSGGLNTALQSLALYDISGAIGQSVSKPDGHDPATIKDEKTATFVIPEPNSIEAHGPWLNLTISTMIERMAKDRTNRRVRIYVDEFSNLGYVPNIVKAVGLYRGQGQQYFLYTQALSQIRSNLGEENYRNLMGLCDVVQVLAARDPQICRELSEMAGQVTVKEYGQSLRPDVAGDQMGFSSSASNVGVPLIRPEEIRSMDPSEQLVFVGGMQPMVLMKASYLDNPKLRRLADPNPYYERGDAS